MADYLAGAPALAGRRILVVEDDYFVSQILCDLLEAAGAVVIGPIGWSEEALAFIALGTCSFDGAVLDLNLHGVRSYAIADALTERNVRFVFVTGYSADAVEAAYRGFPRCEKPINAKALVAALAPVVTPASRG